MRNVTNPGCFMISGNPRSRKIGQIYFWKSEKKNQKYKNYSGTKQKYAKCYKSSVFYEFRKSDMSENWAGIVLEKKSRKKIKNMENVTNIARSMIFGNLRCWKTWPRYFWESEKSKKYEKS